MSTLEQNRITKPATEPDRAPARQVSIARTLRERRDLYFVLCAIAVLNVVCVALMWTTRRLIDYRAFYTAGRLALSSPELVYSAAAQQAEQLRNFPGQIGWIAFNHPPAELLIFAPLARLPYAISLALWTSLSAGFVFLATWLLAPVIGLSWRQLIVLSFALYPTCHALYEGQDTALLLLVLSAVLLLASRQQDTWAGIALAVALFKPQIPLVIAAAFLLQGRRKLFGSFCATAAFIALASFAATGRDGIEEIRALLRTQEPQYAWSMPNIRGMQLLLHAPQAATILLSFLLLAGFAILWYRSEHRLLPMFSSAILVGALTTYHFQGYDLALLVIPIAYALTTEISRLEIAAILAMCAAPLSFLLLVHHVSSLLAIPVIVLLAFYRFNRRAKSPELAIRVTESTRTCAPTVAADTEPLQS